MKIIFTEHLKQGGRGRYIDYQHSCIPVAGRERIDVLPLIRKRQDEWVADMERWHTKLSRVGSAFGRWWWLSPASRLLSWYPPLARPLFFALAVREALERSGEREIFLWRCPREVWQYLRIMRPQDKFCAEGRFASVERRGALGVRVIVKYACKMLVESFVRIFSLKKVLAGRERVGIFSSILDPRKAVNEDDHYFGRIFAGDPRVRWIYISELNRDKRFVRAGTSEAAVRIDFITEHLSWRGALAVLGKIIAHPFYAFLLKARAPAFTIGGFTVRSYGHDFLRQQVDWSVPILEWVVYYSFREFLKVNHLEALTYPYEEKGIERAMILAVKDGGHKTRMIAFLHAVGNEGHLYFRDRGVIGGQAPRPDICGVTGLEARDWLRDHWGWDSRRVVVVGSPRFQDNKFLEPTFRKGLPLKVLVLIGQEHEMRRLADILEGRPDVFDGCELLVRPYPFAWQSLQEEALARIRKCMPGAVSNARTPLYQQLAACHVALYCSTSAGFEAMAMGRLTVYVDLHEVFRLDPLKDKPGLAGLMRAEGVEEITARLKEIRGMDEADYLRLVLRQRELAQRIYTPFDDKAFWTEAVDRNDVIKKQEV